MKDINAINKFDKLLDLATRKEDKACMNYMFYEKVILVDRAEEETLKEMDTCIEWFENPRSIFKEYVDALVHKYQFSDEAAKKARALAQEHFFGETLNSINNQITKTLVIVMNELIAADQLYSQGITYAEYQKFQLILDDTKDVKLNNYDLTWKIDNYHILHQDIIRHYNDFKKELLSNYAKNTRNNSSLIELADEIMQDYSNYLEQYKHDPVSYLVLAENKIEQYKEQYTTYMFRKSSQTDARNEKDELLQDFKSLLEQIDSNNDLKREIDITISCLQRIEIDMFSNVETIQKKYRGYLEEYKYRILENKVNKIVKYYE